jgi:Circularly permuted ATP-grasp type 2
VPRLGETRLGLVSRADRRSPGAARREAATGREAAQVGRATGDCVDVAVTRLAVHCRGQEPRRVGVGRRAQYPLDRTGFDKAAGIHDRDRVGDLGRDAEIMRDKDHPHAELALQIAQQDQDLHLHGRIERGRRLVGEQQARSAAERHSDHRPLPQAAGQLVRIGVETLPRRGDADQLQQFQCPRPGAPAIAISSTSSSRARWACRSSRAATCSSTATAFICARPADWIDVIYRRINGDFLLGGVPSDSVLRVRGLMRAYFAGNAPLGNVVGTGVADYKGVYAYMPRMIRYHRATAERFADLLRPPMPPRQRCARRSAGLIGWTIPGGALALSFGVADASPRFESALGK